MPYLHAEDLQQIKEFMARRLVNTEFKSADSTSWTLEIWDLAVNSADLDYTVEMNLPGFKIQWLGDEASSLDPLLPSSCSFTLSLTEEQRGAIMSRVYGSSEFSLAVKVKKAGAAYWVGQIHPEETTEVIEDGYITVDFMASDGLAQLENIDFKQEDGEVYIEKYSAASYIQKILMKVPTYELWYNDSGVGSVFMYEHFLNRPVIQDDSFAFSHSGNDGVTRGVLDYLHLDPITWYLKDQDPGVVGDEFLRYPTSRKDGFVSCLTVLSDILSSLGATICFSKGNWRIFDRCYLDSTTASLSSAQVIQYARKQDGTLEAAFFNESIDLNVDLTTSEFDRGIVRRAIHPLGGASQVHKNSGSDLMYGSGVGYSVQGLPVYFFEHENDTFPTSNTSDPSGIHNFAGVSPVSSSMTYNGLSIPNGNNDGVIRLHFSGNCDYLHVINGIGSLAILSFKFQLTDSDGIDYRLKRRVRTLRYSSTGVAFGVNVVNSSIDYYPKFYESDYYEWVASDESGYGEAQVDLMLGADPSLLSDGVGSTEQFLTVDFPSFAFNTPPNTKLDPSNAGGNVLLIDPDVSKRRFIYRFDQELSTPDASNTIVGVTMDSMWLTEWRPNAGPNVLYNSSGVALPLGTDVSVPSYRTESKINANDGVFLFTNDYKPMTIDLFRLSGFELFNGDGTTSFDNRTLFLPTNSFGSEIYSLKETSLGGGFRNTGDYVQGRFLASSFSDAAHREDNFKMSTAWDSTDVVNRMNERTTKNLMQIRDRTRQVVEGSLFSYATNASIVEPWQRLVSSKLSGDVETFVPHRTSLAFDQLRQNLTMMMVRGTSSTITGTVDSADQGKGGRPANGGFRPGGDVAAVFGKTLSVSGDLVSLESEVDAIDTVVGAIAEVIKATTGGGGKGVYTDSAKGTTSSYMGLSSTSAVLQAGGGNTALNLLESSPGRMTMKVQVGPSGSETSATAIDIQGQTGAQLPDIVFNGNISGIDVGDLDNVSSATPSTNDILAWSGSQWAPVANDSGAAEGITSTGDITAQLDSDNNSSNSKFEILAGDGSTIWSVNESGVTTGLLTTATPNVVLGSASYQQGAAATAAILNSDATNSYDAKIYNGSGSDTNIVVTYSNGILSFTVPPTVATGWELRVFAIKPGFFQSAVSVDTFSTTASTTFSYWRIQMVDSSGVNTQNHIYLADCSFFSGANQSGTEYPSVALTSATSDSTVTVSHGYQYSGTYADWKAFDSSINNGWWTLNLLNNQNYNADDNWIQLYFTGGAVNLQSIHLEARVDWTTAEYAQVIGSNTGSFSGEEVLVATLSGVDTGAAGGWSNVNANF